MNDVEKLLKIKRNRRYCRMGDMDCTAALNLHMQPDGDIVVWVGAPHFPSGEPKEVEFCTTCGGGGRSDNVRKALVDLMLAIDMDNEQCPIIVNNVVIK